MLTSLGYELDRTPAAFGSLKSSAPIVHQPDTLRRRMQADGYLYLPGLLDAEAVWQARQEICDRLAAEGCLDPNFPRIAAVARAELKMHFRPDLVPFSPRLHTLLYTGTLMAFYQQFLGGTVLHFDYTWLRAVAPGFGTHPHCDIVYMGRGTPNLYTTWTPLGDVSMAMGGLMILEKSHHLHSIRNSYGQKDVDSYCLNRKTASLYRSGQKSWNGALSSNPVSLRQRYGGRWLTNEFKAGDVLVFGMYTIHASLDNHSNQIRLSSDSRYQLHSEPVDRRWVGLTPGGHGLESRQGRIC
ncbi:phytanoyl-CoA dioxygenase family protein [Kovacikia minuta CCNUW1]|uniref:phytanoyl-CoA dioxygenase family protein n=1 Tax=Kovacikia minuta TaxID=2931930 RepID=UPI001CCAF61A|nr:phytanoyl-CoA dioxygenase family protein [Kovacikia minuta]UBF25245.1 phytanoyl-CoA dioxygenase family protein [Kovacikia minuta CCNUW1]